MTGVLIVDHELMNGCPRERRIYPDGCGHSITHRLDDGSTRCSFCLQSDPLPAVPPGP